MLKDDISSAKKHRNKQQVQLIIACIVIVFVCVLAIFAIDYAQKHLSADVAPATANTQITALAVPATGSPTLAENSTLASEQQLRATFLEQLNIYESTLKIELANTDLARWDQARHVALLALEENMVNAFSASNYVDALRYINELQQLAELVIAESQTKFVAAFAHAQQFYDMDQYEDVKFHIDQALMFKNNATQATELADKIDQLATILPLVQQANIAKVENNYTKELSLLNQILQIAPDRVHNAERKHVLQNIINRQSFATNIAQSYKAIEQGDIATARKKLQQAQSIFPQAQEVQDVQAKLKDQQQEQQVFSYQQAVKKAVAADDWEETSKLLQLILQQQEGDKKAQDLLHTAQKIIALHKFMDKLLANPYRLSNKKTLEQAEQNILESNKFFEPSPSLKKKSVMLADIAQQMHKTLMVEVISDNKTYIVVRGTGVVGKTLKKTIQLTPGNYIFEGKRKGFKSKLVKVLLPYTESSDRVTIICDEPI